MNPRTTIFPCGLDHYLGRNMRKFLAITALAASTVGIAATTATPAMAATF